MNRSRLWGLAAVMTLGAALAACDDRKPAAAGASASTDITDYLARRAGCNHWGGEEGTDAARRAEINRNMTALKCGQIDQDEAALLQRYHDRPQLQKQIHDAHDKLL